MVETPVLFVTFVRHDYARQTWEGIKAAKPQKLYFYSNKGRVEKEREIERNNEIRSFVKEIDWECDLHTWFRDESVDIYTSLRGAISWLFDNEEEGIILEEDCVPSLAFFSFCDQMIFKYKTEKKVWCISGDNYLGYSPSYSDYFFSQYHFMFGWASWADRWNQIEWDTLDVKGLIKSGLFYNLYKTKKQAKDRERELWIIKKKVEATKCWDYAFGYIIDVNEGVTVHPKEHLVTSIGLWGTHSKNTTKTMFHIKANPKSSEYVIKHHPDTIQADKDFDLMFFKKFEWYKSFYNRVKRMILRKFKCIL